MVLEHPVFLRQAVVTPHRHHADHRQLQQLVAGLSDGVILVAPDQSIAWANQAALAMHGIQRIADLGATVSEYRTRFELRTRNRHRLPEGQYPMERVLAGVKAIAEDEGVRT